MNLGIVLTAIGVLLAVAPRVSEACSCIDVSRTEEQEVVALRAAFDEAVAVFTGEAIAADLYGATFVVQQVWKGDVGEHVTLKSNDAPRGSSIVSINSCDYYFTAGRTYLVFSYGPPHALKARHCTPTGELRLKSETLQRLKTFATAKPPNKALEPAAFTMLLVDGSGCRGGSTPGR